MLPLVYGELHYPRIPRAYWQARLAMARAMGLDAVSTYVFWNYHERTPGEIDFEGQRDVAHFVRLAQREGLDVVLRPGPYVCAEWDFGGLPWWLQREGEIPVRTADERFMQPAARWLRRLGEELAPLQRSAGGPIVAVQLENEYGAFGADRTYLLALRAALEEAGFGASPFYTIDQPKDAARGALDGLPVAITFAPGDPEREFAVPRALRPGDALHCGEFWAGWFDRWGAPRDLIDEDVQVRDLEWMLQSGISANVYMFHGGTNFGFWNGTTGTPAQPYQPVTTSYDYQAALDEAGRPTAKYHRFRDAIARVRGAVPLPVPASPGLIAIAPFALHESVRLSAALGEPVTSPRPRSMEALGQAFGYVWYRTTLRGPRAAMLALETPCDYAVIAIDGRPIAHLDRRLNQTQTHVAIAGERALLDILVENGGRINYGPGLGHDRKGISGSVTWGHEELLEWQMYALPFDEPPSTGFAAGCSEAPAFYRGSFEIDAAGDTYLDVRELHKGSLWINGHNAGRFWDIGPQRALYVPGVWLRRGRNEAIALDLFGHDRAPALLSAASPA
jgi:beta-galactosidase